MIRVFIADDHAEVHKGVRTVLRDYADCVVAGFAMNGHDVLDGITLTKPDVTLMDVQMPCTNGIEVTRKLIEERITNTRVIMLTQYEKEEYVREAMDAGAWGYLLKDNLSEVGDAIRSVHAGKMFIRPMELSKYIEGRVFDRLVPPEENPLEMLTPREKEIAGLIGEGKSMVEITGLSSRNCKHSRVNHFS